ncbi:MAG: thiamine phosphate synthase [Elainellaceae cyanobacterium]
MTDYQPSESSDVIYRILDANLDRAREGLRIIEEWCRFGLNNAVFAGHCKDMRQALARWHTTELRAARNTPDDPGTDLTHPDEARRSGLEQLLQANFCRVEEALRVLEEYGKLYQAEMSAGCKQMRYDVYTLESQLLGHQRHRKLLRSQLYLVTSPRDDLLSVVEAALQGGLSLVQYREKTADDKTRIHQAKQLKQLCHDYDALFIVNDRIDLALAVGADGVHLGQHDAPVALARQMLGPHCIVGKSTTSPKEMEQALAENPDYIGVGPVYETPTKAGKAAAGLAYVRHAQTHSTVPWFCIGGINADNLGQVLGAGATRVSAVRAIMDAERPTLITQYFLSQLVHAQTMRSHSFN